MALSEEEKLAKREEFARQLLDRKVSPGPDACACGSCGWVCSTQDQTCPCCGAAFAPTWLTYAERWAKRIAIVSVGCLLALFFVRGLGVVVQFLM